MYEYVNPLDQWTLYITQAVCPMNFFNMNKFAHFILTNSPLPKYFMNVF